MAIQLHRSAGVLAAMTLCAGLVLLGAAAALLRDASERLWRRLACVAFEDIGVVNLNVVGLATAALAGKPNAQSVK